MVRRVLVVLCSFAFGLAAPTSSLTTTPSFEAFQLHSGMTPDEVSKRFPNYELRWMNQPPTGAAMLVRSPVNTEDPDIYASLAFCHNRLVSVIRNVDPDTDFLGYVQEYTRDFGQPQVKVEKHAWTGPHGGDITSLELTWIRGDILRSVTLVPEGRTGAGELRYIRYASVRVGFNATCSQLSTLTGN